MTAEVKVANLPRVANPREVFSQVLKYALVGLSNTAIDAAAYYALTRWLGLGSLPVLAKALAYALGMVNSFHWNRTWTFKSRGNPWRAAALFTLSHIAALGINAGTMAFGLNILHLPEAIALAVATAAAFGWNFALNKLVVFRVDAAEERGYNTPHARKHHYLSSRPRQWG